MVGLIKWSIDKILIYLCCLSSFELHLLQENGKLNIVGHIKAKLENSKEDNQKVIVIYEQYLYINLSLDTKKTGCVKWGECGLSALFVSGVQQRNGEAFKTIVSLFRYFHKGVKDFLGVVYGHAICQL